MNLWRKSLCGYWTPATFDKYANVGWFGLLRPEAHQGDIDRLTPRLLYGRLQDLWLEDRSEWSWIILFLVSLTVATFLTYHTRTEWLKRSAQVRELESRASVLSSASRQRVGVNPSSPLLGTIQQPKERRSSGSRMHGHGQPGPSSRAVAGTGTYGATASSTDSS